MSYRDFIEGKVLTAEPLGFEIDADDINPVLKPHQRAMLGAAT